jgi:formate-dependent phosphoribosylglycinamide formyltransferase (GAR transformylase)
VPEIEAIATDMLVNWSRKASVLCHAQETQLTMNREGFVAAEELLYPTLPLC